MTGRRLALLVATDSYQDSGFSRLRAPVADAEALRAVLEDPGVGGYSVEVLTNKPAHILNEHVEGFLGEATVRDMVLLYFSGHGYKDDHGRLYMVATNTRRDHIASTAVSASFVRDHLDHCRSRGKVVLLDCCYAGAFPAGAGLKSPEIVDVLERLSGRGSAVMTASSAIEHAFESSGPHASPVAEIATPSVFTTALIDGLRSGKADRNGDGFIDFDELYDYVYSYVRERVPQQSPSRNSQLEGTLYVAVSPAGPRPARLPPALTNAINSPISAVRSEAVIDLLALSVGAHPGIMLTVCNVLGTLANDVMDDVAAAAAEALRKIKQAESTDEIFMFADGTFGANVPSLAAQKATDTRRGRRRGRQPSSERDITRLREAAYTEIEQRLDAAELELADARAAAERDVLRARALTRRDRDEILTTAKRQADEMRNQALRAFKDSEAARAVAESDFQQRLAEDRSAAVLGAETVVRQAQEKAAKIIADAKAEARQVITDAMMDVDRLRSETRLSDQVSGRADLASSASGDSNQQAVAPNDEAVPEE